MTSLLLTFLIVAVVPLITASWRWSLVGLLLQGLLLATIAWRLGAAHAGAGVLLVADFLLLRGWLGPRWLWRILARGKTAGRHDVIPANLLFWTLAAALIALAFGFSGVMVPGPRSLQVHLGVAVSCVLLAMLVLATRNSTLSQILGVLRLENGIALFELASQRHHPWPVQVGFTAVYGATLWLLGTFLAAAPSPSAEVEGASAQAPRAGP